ncbi:hypothetical protein NDN08_005333 [Rhodosorus marinus]|uniref:Uncharacterized protein n=1 Tax=Rhodosorus marinus TaxID=101924 RepID=A0AAV8V194_9RHOD|nr:hypothetical protein NDN08_005333 [Rhodosorus marinus]
MRFCPSREKTRQAVQELELHDRDEIHEDGGLEVEEQDVVVDSLEDDHMPEVASILMASPQEPAPESSIGHWKGERLLRNVVESELNESFYGRTRS